MEFEMAHEFQPSYMNFNRTFGVFVSQNLDYFSGNNITINLKTE